jgi:hypothetical protein
MDVAVSENRKILSCFGFTILAITPVKGHTLLKLFLILECLPLISNRHKAFLSKEPAYRNRLIRYRIESQIHAKSQDYGP